MGCFVRGGKNGMGCFVRGDKNCMGRFVRGGKLMRDVLSGVAKNGMGCFVLGCFVLHSDKTDPEYLQCLQTTINRIPTDKGAHLWLGGDFNLPDINWEEETVAPYGS